MQCSLVCIVCLRVWNRCVLIDLGEIDVYVCMHIYLCIYLFIEDYHAACGPCGTISLRIAGFSYRSLRRVDHDRKANRASQLNDGDSTRKRERRRD